MSTSKKVVVIGGTGLIGSRAVAILRNEGHEAVVATPSEGIDALAGTGLEAALQDADAVIDVSNIMSFDPPVVRNFFETSSRNLTSAEKTAGVGHHVTLSIVAADGLTTNPYMAGKIAQENAVKSSGQPYTIVRATQFFEFLATLADAYTAEGTVKVPDIFFQPIAADDVAAFLVETALGTPRFTTVEIAGPHRETFKTIMSQYLVGVGDTRTAATDPSAGYFGSSVVKTSLVPAGQTTLGGKTLNDWLHEQKRVDHLEKAS